MPQTVRTERKVRTLARGDRVVQGDEVLVVASFDHKIKWSTVRYEDGTQARVTGDTDVLVETVEDTKEERSAKRRTYVNEVLAEYVAEAPGAVDSAQAALIENLRFRPGYHVDYYAAYVAAQTKAQLWSEVEKAAAVLSDEGTDLCDALNVVLGELADDFLHHASRRASRSSNVMTNAIEDVAADERHAFYRKNSSLVRAI